MTIPRDGRQHARPTQLLPCDALCKQLRLVRSGEEFLMRQWYKLKARTDVPNVRWVLSWKIAWLRLEACPTTCTSRTIAGRVIRPATGNKTLCTEPRILQHVHTLRRLISDQDVSQKFIAQRVLGLVTGILSQTIIRILKIELNRNPPFHYIGTLDPLWVVLYYAHKPCFEAKPKTLFF